MEDLTLNSANSKHVKESLSRVFINDEEAKKIKDVFIAEMESGLRNGLEGSSLQMENTYVTELISGELKSDRNLLYATLT